MQSPQCSWWIAFIHEAKAVVVSAPAKYKRRYAIMIQAGCSIGKIMGRYPETAQIPWQWYECPVCRGFHLTKEPQDNPEYEKRRFMAGLPVRD